MSARSPLGSAVATTRGDDGTTGLLFGGPRIPKDDPRAEAYGTIDEAVAALGVARAATARGAQGHAIVLATGDLGELLLRLQRELFVVGAELATTPVARDRLEDGRTRVSAEMVSALEDVLVRLESSIAMPREFTVPGETPPSASLEVARAVVRRAERRVVALRRSGHLAGDHLLPYLNRLADLLWVLARAAEQAEARPATLARTAMPSPPARPAAAARAKRR